MNLNTGELLLVAGKGHEKTQDYGALFKMLEKKPKTPSVKEIVKRIQVKRVEMPGVFQGCWIPSERKAIWLMESP